MINDRTSHNGLRRWQPTGTNKIKPWGKSDIFAPSSWTETLIFTTQKTSTQMIVREDIIFPGKFPLERQDICCRVGHWGWRVCTMMTWNLSFWPTSLKIFLFSILYFREIESEEDIIEEEEIDGGKWGSNHATCHWKRYQRRRKQAPRPQAKWMVLTLWCYCQVQATPYHES